VRISHSIDSSVHGNDQRRDGDAARTPTSHDR